MHNMGILATTMRGCERVDARSQVQKLMAKRSRPINVQNNSRIIKYDDNPRESVADPGGCIPN